MIDPVVELMVLPETTILPDVKLETRVRLSK